jgi:hypothetical protein
MKLEDLETHKIIVSGSREDDCVFDGLNLITIRV